MGERQSPDMRMRMEQAEALHALNVTTKEIAKKIGVQHNTVRQWVARGKWSEKKKARQSAAIAIVDGVTESALTDYVMLHQKREAAVYERHLDRLAEFDPKKSGDFVNCATALKTLSEVARRNLGMEPIAGSPAGATTFNFNLGEVKAARKQVLDVPAEIIQAAPEMQADDDILS
jgi:hypothetical protein